MVNDRIEICGAIASGKTTLTKSLEHSGYNVDYENFKKISMLDDFYLNPAEYSFETEISFTLQHYYQIKKRKINSCIFDFSLINDYTFSKITLSGKEFALYQELFNYIINKVGKPRKIIILSTDTNILLSRIMNRGRKNEISIKHEYLNSFKNNLNNAINEIYYDVPSIYLDTDKVSISEYNNTFLQSLSN